MADERQSASSPIRLSIIRLSIIRLSFTRLSGTPRIARARYRSETKTELRCRI
jgi:hypothetical protein